MGNESSVAEDETPAANRTVEIVIVASAAASTVVFLVILCCSYKLCHGKSGKIALPPQESPASSPGKIRASLAAFEDRAGDEVELGDDQVPQMAQPSGLISCTRAEPADAACRKEP